MAFFELGEHPPEMVLGDGFHWHGAGCFRLVEVVRDQTGDGVVQLALLDGRMMYRQG